MNITEEAKKHDNIHDINEKEAEKGSAEPKYKWVKATIKGSVIDLVFLREGEESSGSDTIEDDDLPAYTEEETKKRIAARLGIHDLDVIEILS